MKETMDFGEMQKQVKEMSLSALLDLQRAVESELEARGETTPFQAPDSGVFIGQGVYTIGEHISAGTYSFYLPKHISRDASKSTYLFIFEDLEKYQQHLEQNRGRLGTIPSFSVYRNSPVFCVALMPGQILAVHYNGAIISKFTLTL